ncbi:MAG: Ferric uptake regulator [Methanothrix sp.]|jgi:Fur family peroxide stress response transcriptional regulator|nr:MAG: Ferric uptake regulator [Methanothrix sp.]
MAESGDLESSIIKTFRNSGYRATPQRIAISRYILSSHSHPTAQKVYGEVKKDHPTVSLATIYTTIKALKEMGMIQELNHPQSETRLDPNMEPHLHLICSRCERISDWMDPEMEDFIARVSDEADFVVTGLRFDLKGICSSCKDDGVGGGSMTVAGELSRAKDADDSTIQV